MYLSSLWFFAGIAAYAALNHALIGLRGSVGRNHLWLAAMCLASTLYCVTQARLFTFSNAAAYIELYRWNLSFFFLSIYLMLLFVQAYIGENYWFPSTLIGLVLIASIVMIWLSPFTILFQAMPSLRIYQTSWGETITLTSVADGIWVQFLTPLIFSIYLALIALLIRHYWRERNRTTLLMVGAIGFYVLMTSQGVLVRIGVIGDMVPLGPLGISIIPFAMSVTLSRELRQNDQRLRDVLDHVPAQVCVKDAEGRYLMVNRYFLERLKRPKSEVIGQSDERLFPLETANANRVLEDEIMRTGRGGEFTEQFNWDGESHTYLSLKFPLRSGRGEPMALCIVATDITQREHIAHELQQHRLHLEELVSARTQELSDAIAQLKHTQDDLIQAEKLASLGSMVAGVSHELNTPIGNAVTVVTTLIDQARRLDADFQSGTLKRLTLASGLGGVVAMAELIERSVTRAVTLIASFKQVAIDQTSERRREFEVQAVVGDVINSLRAGFRNKLCRIENTVPPGITCDSFPGSVEQILTNLIQNAVLHAFAEDTTGTITVSALVQDNQLELSVRDDGVGMNSVTLTRIFDPFFTTKLGQGGSGLGLSICHRIANTVLAGDINVVSSPGCGSTFTLKMPLRTPGKL